MLIRVFSKYASIGALNTILHWMVFFILCYLFSFTQTVSNFIAFLVAVTFSYIANSKWTYNSRYSFRKYCAYTVFMGGVAILIGYFSELMQFPMIVTLLVFSSLSLFLGFIFSNYFIFRTVS